MKSRLCACLAITLLVLASMMCGACKHSDGNGPVGTSTRPDNATGPIDFSFDSLDARHISSGTTRGRPVVLAFVTTWDLTSQAQVDFLVPMAKHDGAEVTYALVALQEAKDRELVEVYRSQLKVEFPVALADKDVIAGGGPFGDVHAVPTTVILDRTGRMIWRHVGLAKPEEIRAGLRGL